MKRITESKTSDFFVGQNEILFTRSKDSVTEFFAFDNSWLVKQVDHNYFALSTVGENYEKIEEQLFSQVQNFKKTEGLNGETFFCNYQMGTIHGFDKKGERILEWKPNVGLGHAIYDIKFQTPDYLWLAFPTGHTITQVSISQRKEIFRIGNYTYNDITDPLNYPESIFIRDNFLPIPNMGNGELLEVNLVNKELSLKDTFESPLWQYEETPIGTFTLTNTGIYLVEQP